MGTLVGVQRPSEREIRVLDLLQGDWNDDVKCDTRVVSLDANIGYETLSYVWGESPATDSIELSGQRILITPNLCSALRRLRYPEKKRTIWIDQLCINQKDSDEKAYQVSLMRDIYRACSHCVMWLGEIPGSSQGFCLEDAEAAIAFIRSVAEKELPLANERSRSPALDQLDEPEKLPTLFQSGPKGEAARRAFAAFAMYGNPWWQRIWTIQEAILPQSAEIVWGPLSLSRQHVILAARRLKNGPRGFLTSFSVEFQARRRQHDELLRWLLYPVHGILHSWNGEEPLDLFMRWRHRKATNPRDKVYGLLGLLPANILPSAQPCSYDISVPSLFSQVTLDLMQYECGLRPLVASSEMMHTTADLPSWAIDFACSNRVGKRQLKWWGHSHRYGQFSACGEHQLQLAVSDEGNTLKLTGVLVDQVLKVNRVYTVADDKPLLRGRVWDIMSSSEDLLNSYMASRPDQKQYPGGGSWESSLWRTMLGDLIMDEFPVERAKDSHEVLFERAKNRLAQGKPEIPNVVLESLRGMIPNHAFFITESGYIGIGPPHTLPGDQIWVFYGGQVPFVMRKTEKEYHGVANHALTLVGDTYVHGIMDGEAVRDGHDAQTAWIY
ncbi:Nn.00g039930.m01.CDS01 [Neocucurbitaria sp. VM-36]